MIAVAGLIARYKNCEIGQQGTDANDKDQLEQAAVQPNMSEISEDEIDGNLMGTFPASDPPSWTLGVERAKQPTSERQLE